MASNIWTYGSPRGRATSNLSAIVGVKLLPFCFLYVARFRPMMIVDRITHHLHYNVAGDSGGGVLDEVIDAADVGEA